MRTIHAAMTWELLSFSRWQLLGTTLAMLALPLLILSMISSISAIRNNPDDVTTQVLFFGFMQANIVALSISLLSVTMQQTPRLYGYPARSSSLANGQLRPAAALMFVDMLVWTGALNLLFRLDWPIFEPAIFSAAAFVAAQAAVWLCYRSRWIIFSLTAVALLFSFWIKSHFGPVFGELKHGWTPMTLAEGVALSTFTAGAYGVGLRAFARNRRGEAPFSVGLIEWLESLTDRRPRHTSPFATPLAAQTWYFQQRSWVAPAVVLSVSGFSIILWSFVNRDVTELLEAYAYGCWFISIAGVMGGLTLGSVGSRGQMNMGQFLATRPITTVDLSRRLLIVAAKSLTIAWICWGAIFLAILLAAKLAGHSPTQHPRLAFSGQMLVGAILLSWVMMTSVIAMALVDRGRLIFRFVTGLSFGFIGLMLFAKLASMYLGRADYTHALMGLLGTACTAGAGVAFTAGTIAAFVASIRRGLLEIPVAVAAVVEWIALIVAAMFMLPPVDEQYRPAAILLFGSLALVVAPIAAVPLAITWNRTR